jgi:hypothetical protein
MADTQIATFLQKAADGTISEREFYDYFQRWYHQTEAPIKDIIFREVEHYWANFHFPHSPRNIIENDSARLRLLARALEENWDVDRTEREVTEY